MSWTVVFLGLKKESKEKEDWGEQKMLLQAEADDITKKNQQLKIEIEKLEKARNLWFHRKYPEYCSILKECEEADANEEEYDFSNLPRIEADYNRFLTYFDDYRKYAEFECEQSIRNITYFIMCLYFTHKDSFLALLVLRQKVDNYSSQAIPVTIGLMRSRIKDKLGSQFLAVEKTFLVDKGRQTFLNKK